MKHLIFTALITMVLLPAAIYCQQGLWGESYALTDSLSDHRNAHFALIRYDQPEEDHYIFFEQTNPGVPSSIYSMNFYDMNNKVMVAGDGIHDYRNPRIIRVWTADTLFFLFYESNQNGNWDIFYKKYTTQGYEPQVQFTQSESDDFHLNTSPGGGIIWENDGMIYFVGIDYVGGSHIFSDPVILDTEAGNPSISQTDYYQYNAIASWEKENGTFRSIYYSSYDHQSQSWSDPELLTDEGFNTNSAFGNSWWISHPGVMIWERENEGMFKINGVNLEWGSGDFQMNYEQVVQQHPCVFSYDLPVTEFNEFGFIGFEKMENDQTDIFVTADGFISPDIETYENISVTPYNESNPQIVFGRYYGPCTNDFICIYESERSNGNRQLYACINPFCIWGGINDKEVDLLELSVWPNPASNELFYSFILEEKSDVSVRLIDLSGRVVAALLDQNCNKGEHQFSWNSADSGLPDGAYVLTIQAGAIQSGRKVVFGN